MTAIVDFKTGGSAAFGATITVNIDFGSASGRALLVRAASRGDALATGAGVEIMSCVIDPAGANIAVPSAGGSFLSTASVGYFEVIRSRDYQIASASMPTGIKPVVVTFANGNAKPQIWAMTRSGVQSVAAAVTNWGFGQSPTATVAAAAGDDVVAFISETQISDSNAFSVAAPNALGVRVLSAACDGMRGVVVERPGSPSGPIAATLPVSDAWGVVAWALTPLATDTTPPVITGPGGAQGASSSVTVSAGATAVATFSANEAATWAKNGGSNAALFNLSAGGVLTFAAVATAGTYVVVVQATDTAGNATTQTVTVTVSAAGTAPQITTQPASQTVVAGQTATFSVAATGTGLTYQWQRNGAAIGVATAASYSLSTALGDSGAVFRCLVSGDTAPAVLSSAATLTVNAASTAPQITQQPISQTATVGQQVTFSVVATGTAPLAYQWRVGGVAVAGAVAASYTRTVQAGDNGAQVTVVVSNSLGQVTSTAATMTVTSAAITPGSVQAGPFFNNTLVERWRSQAVVWSWWPGATQRIGSLTATPIHGVGAISADGILTPGLSGYGVLMVAIQRTDATDDDVFYMAF
jgi:hypothetical protein